MCNNCLNCKKNMKKPVSITVECKKVYYINNEELVEEIDKLIKKFNKDEEIQTLDGGEETEGGNK
jgi:hypothetical protein